MFTYIISLFTIIIGLTNSSIKVPNKNDKKQNEITNKLTSIFRAIKNWKISNKENYETVTIEENYETPIETIKKPVDYRTELMKNEVKALFYYHPTRYEDNRAQRLSDGIEFLIFCQKAAKKYALSTNETANEYLLKARYREDRENFFNSFKLESKVTFYNT